MPYGMYLSAEGAQAQSRRLEVIANNLANVNTVGFKPDVTGFQARLAEAIQQHTAMHGDRSANDIGGGVDVIDVTTDYSAGRLQETGNSLDLAIIGEGFFEIDVDGERHLTKAGDFTLDSQNRLIDQSGNPVLSSAGGEINIDPRLPWELSPRGEIVQGGASTPLSLVAPASPGDLVKVGQNLFRPLADTQAVETTHREVRQGFLEMSATNSTQQMMTMIETTRAFEANMRMIQNHDTVSGSLISRVLRSS
jgi:flagellar basal-body rod protein FlgF